MQPTERLFDKDPYMTEFSATVLCWRKGDGAFFAALDRTAFFPEGGGQFCDLGTLYNADVLDVQEDESGVIWHKINKPVETGIKVTGRIDWNRRFDFMQQHSGEHIFSGLAHTHFGATNVGFHLGLESTTIDLDVPLSEENISFLEKEANEAVYKNLPIEISYPEKDELALLPYRSKKELSGRVRIVTVPGYDICACCGTHVAKTGEIGLIKITSFQNYKGGTRLFMLCGKRAYLDYRRKNADVLRVTTSLSVKPEELCSGFERLSSEITEHKIYEGTLRRELFAIKAKSLGTGERIAVFEENLSPDEIRRFCLTLAESFGVAGVFSGRDGEWKYAVASNKNDCRSISKVIGEVFCGRGGGKPELVQGSCGGSRREIEELFKSFS